MLNKDMIVQRNSSIPTTDVDGELGMMSIEKGNYYTTNEIGKVIWDLISDEISVSAIVNQLMNSYDVDEATCYTEVKNYLESMIKNDLVIIK